MLNTNFEMTTSQAMKYLGVSRARLMRLVNNNELPHHMNGRNVKFLLADLQSYQEQLNGRGQAKGAHPLTCVDVYFCKRRRRHIAILQNEEGKQALWSLREWAEIEAVQRQVNEFPEAHIVTIQSTNFMHVLCKDDLIGVLTDKSFYAYMHKATQQRGEDGPYYEGYSVSVKAGASHAVYRRTNEPYKPKGSGI